MKKNLFLVAIAAVMMSCSTATSTPNIAGEWTIVEAMGVNAENGDSPATIQFDSAQVNGCSSVNRFFGSYTLNGDTLDFGPMGMTRMMGGSMEIEQAVVEALDKVKFVSVDGNQAVLLNANREEVMKLNR